jgi:hypothetical protein
MPSAACKCTDCHYSLNNPVHYQESQDNTLSHLLYDPRRLEIGEYIERPDHTLARGQSAQIGWRRRAKPPCAAASRATTPSPPTRLAALPERHMQEVACETCHVPQMFAPAIESYDWTVIKPDGSPVTCAAASRATTPSPIW